MSPDTAWYEARNLLAQSLSRECAALHSLVVFTAGPANAESESTAALTAQAARFNDWLDGDAKARGAKAPVSPWASDATARQVPVRTAPFGPVQNQNDDALLARLGPERYGRIKLISGGAGRYASVLDRSGLYAYEILNFVNGKRTAGEIRDAVSAEFGPIPIAFVADYLGALADAKIIALTSPK